MLFGWFRRLIPQSRDFYTLFEQHWVATQRAAETLCQLARGEGDRASLVATIRECEHAADEVIREVLGEVRQTFLTPFDRGAIISLISAMDDTTDAIQGCATVIEIYEFDSFDSGLRTMAEKIVVAVKLVGEALPLLREISRNGHRLHELTARIVAVEGEVDIVHSSVLHANFAHARNSGDLVQFIVTREISQRLEKIADAFEDVANEIDGLVVDHA